MVCFGESSLTYRVVHRQDSSKCEQISINKVHHEFDVRDSRVDHMTSWGDFRKLEPEMSAKVEQLFSIRKHKTIATLRADGSPRISGIECEFSDEQLTFGSMEGARKSADLHRDPRFALHSPTMDPVEGAEASWPGEAKIAGTAAKMGVISEDGAPVGEQFEAEIAEVVFVHLNETATALVIEWWTPDQGFRRVERE